MGIENDRAVVFVVASEQASPTMWVVKYQRGLIYQHVRSLGQAMALARDERLRLVVQARAFNQMRLAGVAPVSPPAGVMISN